MASATTDRRLGLTGDKGYKPPADCATTANITLSGEQTIDGVLTSASRVLVKNQTNTAQNGIYRSSSAAWTRDTDANGNYDLVAGTQILVAGGTQAFTVWAVTATNPITIDSSLITFTQSLSAASLALLASTVSALLGAALIGYNPALAYASGIGQFLNSVYARTAPEIAAGVTPTSYAFPEGDIRRYGATLVAANNAVAINNALLVSANGGSAAFVPPSGVGSWKHTTDLAATLSSSMYGVGPASVLAPQSCNGLVFTNQTVYGGGRFFKDFSIIGTTTTATAAILGQMTAGSGNRVTGINFSGLNIQNFQRMIDIQGFWNCTWRECLGYNNYQGINVTDRNIKVTFVDCHVVTGVLAGVGTRYGLLADANGGFHSEDIVLRGCYIYGHDVNVNLNSALYCIVNQCDLDNSQTTGLQISTVNGGTFVSDCWIATQHSVATKSIDIQAQAAINHDKIVVDRCTLTCNNAFAGSIGINVGNQQNSVTVTNTQVTGFETGIKSNAANFSCKWNSINATTTAISIDSAGGLDNEIGPNHIQGGTAIAFTAGTPPGFSYYARGTYTITLTGLTATVTGTVSWVASGRMVSLQLPGISGTSNTNAMTGTGMPAEIRPVTIQAVYSACADSGAGVVSYTQVASTNGTLFFTNGAGSGAFTAAGVKGISNYALTYPYL